MNENRPLLRILTTYFGVLQSVHLVALIRAGIITASTGKLPFPALPPPEGWSSQAVPFLVSMAIVDALAIFLSLIFAFNAIIRERLFARVGVISLTIADTSAFIFAVGTFASGAWAAHPVAYWLMVALFVPTVPLFVLLLTR